MGIIHNVLKRILRLLNVSNGISFAWIFDSKEIILATMPKSRGKSMQVETMSIEEFKKRVKNSKSLYNLIDCSVLPFEIDLVLIAKGTRKEVAKAIEMEGITKFDKFAKIFLKKRWSHNADFFFCSIGGFYMGESTKNVVEILIENECLIDGIFASEIALCTAVNDIVKLDAKEKAKSKNQLVCYVIQNPFIGVFGALYRNDELISLKNLLFCGADLDLFKNPQIFIAELQIMFSNLDIMDCLDVKSSVRVIFVGSEQFIGFVKSIAIYNAIFANAEIKCILTDDLLEIAKVDISNSTESKFLGISAVLNKCGHIPNNAIVFFRYCSVRIFAEITNGLLNLCCAGSLAVLFFCAAIFSYDMVKISDGRSVSIEKTKNIIKMVDSNDLDDKQVFDFDAMDGATIYRASQTWKTKGYRGFLDQMTKLSEMNVKIQSASISYSVDHNVLGGGAQSVGAASVGNEGEVKYLVERLKNEDCETYLVRCLKIFEQAKKEIFNDWDIKIAGDVLEVGSCKESPIFTLHKIGNRGLSAAVDNESFDSAPVETIATIASKNLSVLEGQK